MNHDITNEVLAEFSTAFSSNPVNRFAMNAVTSAGLLAASKNPMAQRESRHSYSISLEQGEITNQKQSGRCWMFAALNTFRFEVMKNLNLKTFELSQNYTLFYDKLEKSNYFLESILETLDEPTQGRLISFLLSAPLGDGGQWDMLCNLVRKYGVVPKEAMPETVSSSATREMTSALTRKLREDACRLRKAYADGSTLDELRQKKEAMMEEIYRVLCICLGEPPKTFDLEVTDKDDKFIRDTNLTGTAFFEKYVGLKLSDYVSVINAPTADKPFGKSYTVEMLGNVVGAPSVRYINLPMDRFKELAIAQMKAGETVWFGSDVGQVSDRQKGILATNVYDFTASMDINLTQDKAGRLDYSESLMTHAMVLTGVDLDADGKPVKWKVENSWGDKVGQKGYFVASDAWMDEYTYQIVVRKDFLTAEELAAYEAEPQVLAPWDPMGALASK